MAEQVIKHSDIIEDNVFLPTIKEAKLLIIELDKIEAGFKNIATATSKDLSKSKVGNAKEVEALATSLQKVDNIEKGLAETQKAKIKTSERLKFLTDEEVKAKIRYNEANKRQRQELSDLVALEGKEEATANKLRAANRLLARERDNVSTATKEGKKRIEEINTAINANNKTILQNTDSLRQQFLNVGNYKGALKQLETQLQGMEMGTEEFRKTAEEAGKLRDRINDAREASKQFATGSQFGQLKNSIEGVGGSIADLDFAEAADKSKVLADIASKLTFASMVEGLKNLGTALGNVAKAIITNPLFLMAAAITGIVLAIREWAKVTEERAVKATERLTDAIRRQIQGSEELIDIYKRRSDAYIKLLESEVDITNKTNKGRIEAEIRIQDEKIKALKKENEERILFQKELIADIAKLDKEANDARTEEQLKGIQDEIKELEKAKKENKKILSNFNDDLQVLENQRTKIVFDANQERLNREAVEFQDKLDREKALFDYKQQLEEENTKREARRLQEEVKAFNKAEEEKTKAIEATTETTQALNSAVFQGVSERRGRQQAELNKDIAERDKAITQQQDRANRGLENTLLFEEQKRDESALKLKESQDREARNKENEALGNLFLNLAAEYAKNGEPGPAGKAFLDTLAARGLKRVIAGFYDGTEDTGTVNAPIDNKGGRLAILHDNERVITKKQNALIGDMSNDELAQMAYNSKHQDIGISQIVPTNDRLISKMLTEMTILRQTIRDKKEYSVEWDSFGARVESMVEGGIKTTYKKVTTGKQRI